MQTNYCRSRLEKDIADSDSDQEVDVLSNDLSDGQPEHIDVMDIDDPQLEIPEVRPSPPRHRVTIEEVEDEDAARPRSQDDAQGGFWYERYRDDAGIPIGEDPGTFHRLRSAQKANGQDPWYPFESKDKWELARWLTLSGVSQNKINSFLKLNSVRQGIDPAFHNARSLMKRIDALPQGPNWTCTPLRVVGDILDNDGNPLVEELEFWHRDPVECVQELLENPVFEGHQHYEPCRVYSDEAGKNRVYSEMATADWMWKIQELLPKGATACPIIISSDKTQLSRFRGDKEAWPVYISTGLVDKEVRRKSNSHATILLGYIPVSKLECYSKKRRSIEGYKLFHECMRIMLAPLIKAGREGVKMTCADGYIRLMFLILAAYIADYPEQCLVVNCKENSCPKCTVSPNQRGDHRVYSAYRDPDETVELITEKLNGNSLEEFDKQNLRPVRPFWDELPHCNIFECMLPDLLHQLHKGVFNDHLVSWDTEAAEGGEKEIDTRFQAMSLHPSVRHFKRGISLTKQWTGNEFKNMEKVFMGVIAGITDPRVLKATRGVLDFIYYAHFETHTDESLEQLDAAWLMFHENKEVFEELGIRQHFNISKLHNIKHYVDSIRSRGTADGTNTENTERLHIDFAKMGYNASNRKQYLSQMTTWLRRRESILRFSRYLEWAVPGYVAGAAEEEEGEEEQADDSLDKDESVKDAKALDQNASYSLAKKAPIVGVNSQTLVNEYGAVDFLYYLDQFLRSTFPTSRVPLTEATTFSLYKRAVFQLPPIPEVSTHPIRDVIHAVKGSPEKLTRRGLRKAVAGRFSTVLVREKKSKRGSSADSPLNGLRAAQVRVIFKLPPSSGITEPFAYVNWFTPFRNPQPDTGMYRVSHSTNTHVRRASVIRLSDVIRSCHLIPVFGSSKAIDLGWSAERVLEQCKTFYLNPYLRHHDFYYFKHLYNLHLARREKEAQQAAAANHTNPPPSRAKKRKCS